MVKLGRGNLKICCYKPMLRVRVKSNHYRAWVAPTKLLYMCINVHGAYCIGSII